MPAVSQYQNVFRIAKHDVSTSNHNGQQSQGAKPRRNRQPLSCESCRTRKLKCDRNIPCTLCSKRGVAASASCHYGKTDKNGHGERDGDSTRKKSEAQLRLQKLEEMVTSLMQAPVQKSNPLDSPVKSSSHSGRVDQRISDLVVSVPKPISPEDSAASSGDQRDADGLVAIYQGPTHWTTILENIRDIQGLFDVSRDSSEGTSPANVQESPDIVFETSQRLTLADACKFLPPRPVVDRLLNVYFNSGYLRTPFIHRKKFTREYEAFWTDPSSASLLWLSILFSIMWTGTQQDAQEPGDISAKKSYLTKAGQTLVAGGYQNARPYSVEAVLLYGQCKYQLSKEDANTEAWLLMGIGARLAMKMGYHRDPCHLANISPFEGEMRRRTFSMLEAFDILFSLQAGLPAIIHEDECDTESPGNLFDEDFDEDCKVLPPSRPPTDSTPMLYFVYKSRFVKTHRRVVRHALTLKAPSYAETLKLDGELHENHTDVPPSLRMRSLGSLRSDPPHQIMRRLHIETMYLQSLCVLHRKYINHDRSNPAFAYSRKTCTEAALQILKHQAENHYASQPGGRLYHDTWMLSNITLHDFLLAAMIICLDLYESHKSSASLSGEEAKLESTKYDALKLSYEIWNSRSSSSQDAQRACNVLTIMLSKIPRPTPGAKPVNHPPRELPCLPQDIADPGYIANPTANSSEGSSWDTSSLDVASLDFSLNPFSTTEIDATDPLNAVFDGSDNIDWGFLDQYLIQNSSATDCSLDWKLSGPG